MYNAQIGRWAGVDPYDEFASPYIGIGADPVNNIDPDGGSIFNFFENAFLNHLTDAVAGSLAGGIINGAFNNWNEGSVLNGMAWGAGIGLAAGFVNWGAVAGAIGIVGNWVGNQVGRLFQSNNFWILYNGLRVTIYYGRYDKVLESTLITQYAGTSGAKKYQNSINQNIDDIGPVPEGHFKINLKPDFMRKAKFDKNSPHSLMPNPDRGVELVPWFNEFGTLYSDWGQWRARLEKVKVNSKRDFFYFHDSYKGYSHGCIETNTALYYDLYYLKKMGLKSIKVRIKYPFNSSTNGNTRRMPPPWWNGEDIFRSPDGRYWPMPNKNFPDKKNM